MRLNGAPYGKPYRGGLAAARAPDGEHPHEINEENAAEQHESRDMGETSRGAVERYGRCGRG